MFERTSEKKAMRMLNIIDEYTRECLAIHVERQIKSSEVLYKLSELFITNGVPDYIRSNNGSEFTTIVLSKWLRRIGVKTAYLLTIYTNLFTLLNHLHKSFYTTLLSFHIFNLFIYISILMKF